MISRVNKREHLFINGDMPDADTWATSRRWSGRASTHASTYVNKRYREQVDPDQEASERDDYVTSFTAIARPAP